MKTPRYLAAFSVALAASMFSGCAHPMTDTGPGLSLAARGRLDRQEFDRIERENRDYERSMREMTQRSYDNSK